MKEEWKVYIKGVQGRGKEVIKVLTDLGGKINNLNGSIKDWIYFIDHDGSINFAHLSSKTAKIIMDNYKEIKLPEKWKDGDILINNDGTDYKVFWEYDSDTVTSFYAHNVSMHVNGTLTQYSGSIWHGEKIVCFIEDYRLATPSEVEFFHKLLHKHSKDWDVKKKQLVDWKWKLKDGEEYYFIFSDGTIHVCAWFDDGIDNSRFSIGNCFKTKREAETMIEKVRKLLKS